MTVSKSNQPNKIWHTCLQVLSLVGPSKDREREETRRKPGIEDVGILFQLNFLDRHIGVLGLCTGEGLLRGPTDNPVLLQIRLQQRNVS